MTEAMQKAKKKYENTRIQKKISLHKEKDKEMIEYLNNIPDLSNFFKKLIAEKMDSEKQKKDC